MYIERFPLDGRRIPVPTDGDAFETFFSAKGDKLFYRVGRGVMQVPLTVTGDRMTLGRPTMYVEFAFADFLGRGYKLGHDDRLLVKLLPSTTPQSEIRIMTDVDSRAVALGVAEPRRRGVHTRPPKRSVRWRQASFLDRLMTDQRAVYVLIFDGLPIGSRPMRLPSFGVGANGRSALSGFSGAQSYPWVGFVSCRILNSLPFAPRPLNCSFCRAAISGRAVPIHAPPGITHCRVTRRADACAAICAGPGLRARMLWMTGGTRATSTILPAQRAKYSVARTMLSHRPSVIVT
jgi:hypothetical protein